MLRCQEFVVYLLVELIKIHLIHFAIAQSNERFISESPKGETWEKKRGERN